MSRFDDGDIDFSDAFDRLVPNAVAARSAAPVPAAPAAPAASRFQPNVNAARPAMGRGGIAHPPPGGFPNRPAAPAAPAAPVGSMQPGFMSSRPVAFPQASAASAAAAAQSTSLPPQPSWMRRAYGAAPASSPLATHNANAGAPAAAALYSSAPVRAPSNSSPFFAQPAAAASSGSGAGVGAGVRFTTGSNPSAATRAPFRPNLPAQPQRAGSGFGAAPVPSSFQAQYGYAGTGAGAAAAHGSSRPQSAAKAVAFPAGFNPRAAPPPALAPGAGTGAGASVSKFRTTWEPPASTKSKGRSKKAGNKLGEPLPPHLEPYAHTPRGKLPAFLTGEDKRLLRAERKRLRAHADDLTRSSKDAAKLKEVIDLESYSAEYERERKGWNSQRIKVAFQLCSTDRVAIETTPRNEMRIINLIQSIPGALFNRELSTSVSKKDGVAGEYGGLKGLWTIPLKSYDAARARLAGLRGDHLDIVIVEVNPVHLRALRGDGAKTELAVATTFESMQGIPPALAKALYPFQKAGVEFCVNHEGRAMIGDEMGLGKTIQAIAVAAYYADEWPLLVVCPSSVRLTWKNELLKWLGFSSLRETDIMELSSGEDLSDAEADDAEEAEWNPGKPVPTLKSQPRDQFIEDEDDFDFSGAMIAAKKASKAEAAAAKQKKAPSPFIAPEDDDGEAEYTPSALSAEKKKQQQKQKQQKEQSRQAKRKPASSRSRRGRIDSEGEELDDADDGGDMDDFIVPDSDPEFEDEAEYDDDNAAAAAASDASSSSPSSSAAEDEEAQEDEEYVPDDLPIHKKKTAGSKRRRIVESSSEEEEAEAAEGTSAKQEPEAEDEAVPIVEDRSDEEHEKRAAVKLEQPSSPASARSGSVAAAAAAAPPPKLTPKAEFQARLAARQAASAAASAAASSKFPPKKQVRRALPMPARDRPAQQEDDDEELMESLRLIAEMEAKAALEASAASAASSSSVKSESALPAWHSKRSAVKAEPGASPKKEAASAAVVKAEPACNPAGDDDELIDLCSTSPAPVVASKSASPAPAVASKSEAAVKAEPAAYVSAASLIDDSFLAVDREISSQAKPAAAVAKTAAPMPSSTAQVKTEIKSEANVRASPPTPAAAAASAVPSPAAAASSSSSTFVPPSKPAAAAAAAPRSTFRPLTKNNIHVILSGKSPLMGSASSQTRVVIISYDLVPKYTLALARQNFKVIIADESHYLKNAAAKRSQALLPLLESAKRVLCLSGTPAMSRPYELYPQINAIRPTMFGSAHQFGTRYCAPSKGFRGKVEYKGAQNLLELHMLLKKYVLVRRLKAEVLKDLRPKTRTVIVTSVNDRALAESIRSIANIKQIIAAQIAGGTGAPVAAPVASSSGSGGPKKAITQLYADTGVAKLPFILSYLSDLLETGTKFLVFAHHLSVLDGIEGLLRKHHKDAYFRLDGSTKPADRQCGVERFQTDPECKVALLSITAGGTGITLTAASTVVFAELQWTPALLVQAEDRVHRIGQFNPVNCYYLVAHHTLDEILWPMLSAKLEVLGHTLDGKENALEVAGVQGDSAKTTPMEFKKVTPNVGAAAAAAATLFASSLSSSSGGAALKRWDSNSRAEVDLTQQEGDESEAKHARSGFGGTGSGSGSRSASSSQSPPQPSSSASSSKKVTAPFSGWIGMSGGSNTGGGSKAVSSFAASALAAAAAGLRAPSSSALPPAASVSRLLHRDAALSAHMHSTQHARDVSAEIEAEVEARFEPHIEQGPSAHIAEAQRAQPPPQDAVIELDGGDSDEYHSDEY